MKFDVPLMMPAIHSIRLAVSPSRSALMIGNAAGDRTLERDHHALRVRGGEDLVAVPREQRLVRGDDVLAVGDRLQDERARGLDAADQLDDDVDVRVGEHDGGVVGQVDVGDAARRLARAVERALGDPGDPDRPSGAARDLLLVPPQHRPRAQPDRAQSEQADLQRLHLRSRHRHPFTRRGSFTAGRLRETSA